MLSRKITYSCSKHYMSYSDSIIKTMTGKIIPSNQSYAYTKHSFVWSTNSFENVCPKFKLNRHCQMRTGVKKYIPTNSQ